MKKGFMFYLGIFLLFAFAAFLVMIVVLLCSPGTEFLGLKYFRYSQTQVLEKTTDASSIPLELGTAGKYKEIQVETGYARVIVQKTNEISRNSVTIVNNAKGFVAAKNEIKFDYSVLVEDGVLKVNVTEPVAFLSFSSDIRVIIHIADSEANPFKQTKFTIKTNSGNITLGGENNPYSYGFNVGEIDFQTKSGNIIMTNKVNYHETTQTQAFSKATLNIGSGNYTNSFNTLKVLDNLVLQSTSGKFKSNYFVAKNIYIKTESGSYNSTKMSAENVNIECKNGYFYIGEVEGNVTMPSADMNIDSAILKTSKIHGDLTVYAGNNCKFELGEVLGNTNITTTSGTVKAEKGLHGSVAIKTKGGFVNVRIADGNNMAKQITTEGGRVDLYLLGQVQTATSVNTKNGFVKINFETGKSYDFTFAYQTKEGNYDMKKVKFVDYPKIAITNPYSYNSSETNKGVVDIHTDSNVELALFTA